MKISSLAALQISQRRSGANLRTTLNNFADAPTPATPARDAALTAALLPLRMRAADGVPHARAFMLLALSLTLPGGAAAALLHALLAHSALDASLRARGAAPADGGGGVFRSFWCAFPALMALERLCVAGVPAPLAAARIVLGLFGRVAVAVVAAAAAAVVTVVVAVVAVELALVLPPPPPLLPFLARLLRRLLGGGGDGAPAAACRWRGRCGRPAWRTRARSRSTDAQNSLEQFSGVSPQACRCTQEEARRARSISSPRACTPCGRSARGSARGTAALRALRCSAPTSAL